MIERYSTLLGEIIEYRIPDRKVAAFLARVMREANDPEVSSAALSETIYGSANPLLVQGVFRGRGAVTKAVYQDPIHHVLLDLLTQKQVLEGLEDAAGFQGSFTLTVSEAAEKLDITPSAVRQAIQARKLVAVKRGGSYLLDSRSVENYGKSSRRRGPQRSGTKRGPADRAASTPRS